MANEKPPRTGNRRQFVRTQVPASERVASVVILLLLVGIGVAIAVKGRHFDPSVFEVRTASLDSTAAAVDGKSQTVPTLAPTTSPEAKADATATATPATAADKPAAPAAAAAGEGEAGGEGSGAEPKPAPKGEPMEIALDGIKPMSDTEFYNSDNLYEKIDGRAPAYQSFNVVGLRSRSFSVNAQAGSYVDVYEYRFDNPVDAFAMFALERDPKGGALDFAPDGYSGEMGYFFRQGAVYVQVIASDQKPETLALTKAIAQNRAKVLPADDQGLAGRRRLPAADMEAGSVAYVPENAQGQATLKDVYQAKYKVPGGDLSFFIMVAAPEDAAKAWSSFQTFCGRFGKTDLLPDVNGGKIFRGKVFGKWKVVYVRGGELGGVFDAADPDQAAGFVEKYLRGEIK
jgi:hypothetical protein